MSIGESLKQEGLDRVEANSRGWVALMRAEAAIIAEARGFVHVDDLRPFLEKHGHPHHPNAWGAIFRGRDWVRFDYRKSAVPSNHARMAGLWAIRNG